MAELGGERGQSLSPWGYLLFTAWALLVGVLVEGWWLAGLVLVELAFGLIFSWSGLRLLRSPTFWTLVLSPIAVGPFLIGQPEVGWGPLWLSREGLEAGLAMAGRAFVLSMAFSLGMASLSVSDMVAVFDRLGLRGLGFATALALNFLGTLHDMATVTLESIRLRAGGRRPLVALRLFLVTAVASTLRYGDEVVNAATVRAFDPNGGQPRRLPLRPADMGLLAVLVGCGVTLLALSI